MIYGGSDGSPALETLDEYLSSDESPDSCMQLSDLDGFLTGIVVGPELIKPSEWLPVIWGDDSPDFETTEKAEQILSAIMGRYNEIVQALAAEPPEVNPILWYTADGTVIAGDWAEGFLEAMGLRPTDWADMLGDEEAQLSLAPIIMLVQDNEPELASSDLAEEQVELHDAAANLIPSCVIEIDAYWKAKRGAASDTLH